MDVEHGRSCSSILAGDIDQQHEGHGRRRRGWWPSRSPGPGRACRPGRGGAGWRSASSPTRCGTGSWWRRTRRARSPPPTRRPAVSGRRRWGHVIVAHARAGEAPSVAAASCRWGSTLRSTGSTARTTNGTATRAWPTGTSHHDAAPVDRRHVERDQQAEADRDGRRGDRQHQPGVEEPPGPAGGGDGERGEHADGERDRRGDHRRAHGHADGGERVDAEVDAGSDLGPSEAAPRRRASSRPSPAASARRAPPAGR